MKTHIFNILAVVAAAFLASILNNMLGISKIL